MKANAIKISISNENHKLLTLIKLYTFQIDSNSKLMKEYDLTIHERGLL